MLTPLTAMQALQYLRKLCSHPLLVLQSALPSHVAAVTSVTGTASWEAAQPSLHQLEHAPKLAALQQLLQQCNIGVKAEDGIPVAGEEDISNVEDVHRVLVFAQFKGLLDLVERDVMSPMGISYLRLDGR